MNCYGKTRAWLLIGTLAACVLAPPSGAQKSPSPASPPAGTTGQAVGAETSAASAQSKIENPKSKIGGSEAGSTSPKSEIRNPKSPSASASAVMQIRKDVPGDFMVQFLPRNAAPTAPTPLPSPSGTDKVIALSLPSDIKPAATQLQVVDTERGNVARLPVTTKGVMPLTESSFTLIQSVRVPVQAKGQGVTGVQVTLAAAGKYRQSALLLPSDNGIATFRDVPLGVPVTVTVQEGAHAPVSQTQTLTRDHPADGYRWQPIALDWTDVKTVAAPVAATPTAGTATTGTPSAPPQLQTPIAPAQSGGGFFNGLASLVISLLFLAAVGYGCYYAYTTGRLKTFFDKLGIQTAPLTDAGAVAPNPFTKPERTPIQPITEGTADPFGGTAPVGNGAAGYAVPDAGPRLVATMGAYSGNIFPLAAPRTEIGRDAANAVALPQDNNASRRHATIEAVGGQYSVTDNNSSNGTFVNGVRILSQTPQPLRPGDEVQIGQTRFRFEA